MRAYHVRRKVLRDDDPQIVESLVQLGELARRNGDKLRALEFLKPALAALRQQENQDLHLELIRHVVQVVVRVHLASLTSEQVKLLGLVMRKLVDGEPVELINGLVAGAERELQDSKRPSLTESPHPTSPRNANAISSRFASFTNSAPPLLTMAPLADRAAEAPAVLSANRRQLSSPTREICVRRHGQYSSAAQLVAICFLDSIAVIDDDDDASVEDDPMHN
ncbi:hypothetical protein P43SY_002218 [Pythium insidiosum]|uniref:Uncharacterized protein n=1 Tax=Pythium insidiosum TaxID=114742 RepID=A0AAD5LPX7_PYTIN|nr:hypothetical protein P43SY_002218 [Pythium insidiosum]